MFFGIILQRKRLCKCSKTYLIISTPSFDIQLSATFIEHVHKIYRCSRRSLSDCSQLIVKRERIFRSSTSAKNRFNFHQVSVGITEKNIVVRIRAIIGSRTIFQNSDTRSFIITGQTREFFCKHQRISSTVCQWFSIRLVLLTNQETITQRKLCLRSIYRNKSASFFLVIAE